MKRAPRITLFGILLLATLVVGAAVLALSVAAAYRDPGVDFTATWELGADEDQTMEISEDDGVYLVSFAEHDADWRRSAESSKVDRFQLAGRLGAIEGTSPPGEPPAIVQAATGSSVSIVGVNDDTVSASVREDGADSWTDLGTYERAHIWSDPYRAAGLTLLYVLGGMTILLVLWVSIAGGRRTGEDAQPGRLLLRVLGVLGAVALLVAIPAGAPAIAIGVVVILVAPLLLSLFKWLPDEITGTGRLVEYALSPKRRRPYHDDLAAQEAQAARGAALEETMDEVREDWSRPR